MVNPTLLAALTVMLLLPSPKRLMLGYLLGAYLASIASGLVVVFALEESGAGDAGKTTVGPAQDIAIGGLLLIVAFVLRGGAGRLRGLRHARRRKDHRDEPGRESLPIRLLGRGSARVAFAVGVVLSFPGASYLVGLTHIERLDAGTPASVLLVIGFCLVQLLLLELPLLGFVFAPDRTAGAVGEFRRRLSRNGRRTAANLAAVLGVALLVRAVIVLLA